MSIGIGVIQIDIGLIPIDFGAMQMADKDELYAFVSFNRSSWLLSLGVAMMPVEGGVIDLRGYGLI